MAKLVLMSIFALSQAQKGVSCTESNSVSWTNPCAIDGSDYAYSEVVGVSTRTIETNMCPNHQQVHLTPNYAVKADRTFTLPLSPKLIDTPANGTPLTTQGGGVGFLYDNALVFSAYGGQQYGDIPDITGNHYALSAPAVEGYSFDFCGEHSASSSSPGYHAHVPPSCLLTQLGQSDTAASPIIGYMVDGFPIYGPRGPDGVFIKRCSETSANSTFCTDHCGGIEDDSQTHWADGFSYRYFMMGPYTNTNDRCTNDLWAAETVGSATDCNYDWAESFYPFSPICLRGCVDDATGLGGNGLMNVPICGVKTTTAGVVNAANLPAAKAQLPVFTPTCSCSDYPGTCGHQNAGADPTSNQAPTPTPTPSPSPSPSSTSSASLLAFTTVLSMLFLF